jgi:hypothetical protein
LSSNPIFRTSGETSIKRILRMEKLISFRSERMESKKYLAGLILLERAVKTLLEATRVAPTSKAPSDHLQQK